MLAGCWDARYYLCNVTQTRTLGSVLAVNLHDFHVWVSLFSPAVLCRPFPHRGPGCQIYPHVCPFQQLGNQRGLILCPNKLIPQLTSQSKVQGWTQIPHGLIESKLAVNQLFTCTVCLGDAAWRRLRAADSSAARVMQKQLPCFLSQLACFIFSVRVGVSFAISGF